MLNWRFAIYNKLNVMTQPMHYSDNDIEARIIAPLGGLAAFRLKRCPGFKLFLYYSEDGKLFDLILEDDLLDESTIKYLEKSGVPEIE
jgi:hypothetical protein